MKGATVLLDNADDAIAGANKILLRSERNSSPRLREKLPN